MSRSLASLRKAALTRQGGTCFYCRLPIWENDPEPFRHRFGLSERQLWPLRATAEHLIARQDGGRDTPANIVAACIHCNRTRHRCKRPASPQELRERVQRRMASGGWHPACSFEAFPVLAGIAKASLRNPGRRGKRANATAARP